MTRIPEDIAALISMIDRQGRDSMLPRTNTPHGRYDEVVKKALPSAQAINITEFDYGRSYRYSIFLSKNPDAAALDVRRMHDAIQADGPVDQLDVAISAIAPYFHLRFARSYLDEGEVVKSWSDEPMGVAQAKAAVALGSFLVGEGLRRIDPRIATTVVPDVQTELCELGEATVADCLFYG